MPNPFKRLFKPTKAEQKPKIRFENLTSAKVDFNFRIYWTKMGLKWSAAQRATIREQVLTVVQASGFDPNLIEKQYQLPLEGIPEVSHSGTSLLALLTVLNALDTVAEESETNT